MVWVATERSQHNRPHPNHQRDEILSGAGGASSGFTNKEAWREKKRGVKIFFRDQIVPLVLAVLTGILYTISLRYFVFPAKGILTGTEGIAAATAYLGCPPRVIFLWSSVPTSQ
ncbi:hypothetical protein [Pelovirga terrestris]|uniref:Uncharacterized protein n=1 Tax=Pelovirga terrestris TaxID=2771352 RepID=A0A8J6QKN8_9BACT|nr:hypothetical protein [Pelovirga terrestris]MBD1400009.1 hypothetical protein [Pelovirga terrestris]